MFARLISFLRLPITPVKTSPPSPQAAETAGAMMTYPGLIALFNSLQNNASPVFGNWAGAPTVYNGVPAPTQATYKATDMVGGIIKRYNLTGNQTDSTDTGTNIVAAIPGATVGQTFPMIVANLTSTGTLTVGTNSNVTFTGSATISAGLARLFVGQVLGSNLVAFTNCFAFPVAL